MGSELGGGHTAFRRGDGGSGPTACFNYVLQGIGVFVICPLLFLSFQQQGFCSFNSADCVLPAWLITRIFAAGGPEKT